MTVRGQLSSWPLPLTAGACLATGGLAHFLVGSDLAPVIFWPPPGIALGAALIWGLRTVPAAFVGTAGALLWWGMSWHDAILLGAATSVQALAGTLLLRKAGFPGILYRVSDLAKLVIHGGLLAGILAAGLTYLAMRDVDWFWEASLPRCVLAVVAAHMLAALVFVPIVVCRRTAACPKAKGSRWEAGIALLLLLASGMALAHPALMGLPDSVFRPYPLMPFLLWLAMRSNPRYASLGVAMLYGLAASTTGWGQGHLFALLHDTLVLPLHGYVLVVGLSSMALAVLMVSRTLAEDALRASEARLRNLVGLIRNCLWETDARGRFVYLDSHVESVFSLPAAAMLGRRPEDIWPAGLGPALRALFRQTMDGNLAEYAPQNLARADGEMTYLETNCSPLRDASGRHLGWQGITRNVTDRVRMARNLDDSDRRFRQLAESIEEVFWVSDRAITRFEYLSPQCEEVYGVSREELMGDARNRMPAICQDDLPHFHERLKDVVDGKPVDVDFRIHHARKGLRWIRSRSFPFEDTDGKAMTAGIVEDITERKLLEQANMVEALAQRDALIREVHHRIKNNLQTVVGLLRREVGKHPEAKTAIEAAIAQVQSVAVVHGLHGRVTQHTIMLCELLPAIVNNVSELTGVTIRREGVREGCGELRIKDSETVAVALILNELATNAVKHATALGDEAACPLVTMAREGHLARIRMVNAGRLPQAFDFATGVGLGTGLGLVRALVPKPGMAIEYRQRGEEVEVEVVIEAPVLTPTSVDQLNFG